MIGRDEERGQFPTTSLDARDECAERPIHQAIAVEHRGMPGVFEMRRSVDSRKHHKEKTPWGGSHGDPRFLHRAIERGLGPEVLGCRSKDRATKRNAVCA